MPEAEDRLWTPILARSIAIAFTAGGSLLAGLSKCFSRTSSILGVKGCNPSHARCRQVKQAV